MEEIRRISEEILYIVDIYCNLDDLDGEFREELLESIDEKLLEVRSDILNI